MGFVWGLYQIRMVSLFYDALYMLCGIIAIIIGSKIKNQADISSASSTGNSDIGYVLILFGIIIFVVAVVGSLAVVKNNKNALFAFAFCLVVLIILKIIVASFVLMYLDSATRASRQTVIEIFSRGPDDINAIDNIQQSYKCCGILGYYYWATTAESTLPPSCCAGTVSACSPADAYAVGCTEKVGASIEGIGTTISLILFAIAFFEGAGIILGVCLNNTWKNEKRRDEENSFELPSCPSASSRRCDL